MLFLNKEQISAEDLADMFNVPFEKIENAPVFEINPKKKVPDPLNRSYKAPYGKGMMANIFVKDPKTGKTVEIRFAQSTNPERVGDRIIDKYEPRKVKFTGVACMKTDMDEAVFFFIHPNQRNSPLRKKGEVKDWYYEFVDDEARSTVLLQSLQKEMLAMVAVQKLKGNRLTILAKGMGISNVDRKSTVQVQAELMKLAKDSPVDFLNKVDRQATLFDGMVQDAIDKNVFNLKTISGIRRWEWAFGPRQGEPIIDVLNATQDAMVVLQNHIKININEYFMELKNLTTELYANDVSKGFLEKQDMSFLDDESTDGEDPEEEYQEPAPQTQRAYVAPAPRVEHEDAMLKQTGTLSSGRPVFDNVKDDEILNEIEDDGESPIIVEGPFVGIDDEQDISAERFKPQPAAAAKQAPKAPGKPKDPPKKSGGGRRKGY